jgi:predicted secreted Zn-dependent protease
MRDMCYLGIFDSQRTRSITVPRHVLRRQVVHELRLLDDTSAKDITKRERS